MPLNEKQIKILQVINAGNISGDSIAQALGTSMQMLRYYLDTMAEDGYLKAAKVFDNKTREFLIVRAYLTEEGKAALDRATSEQSSNQIAATPQPNLETDDNKSLEDTTAILKSLDVLKEFVDKLPDGRRELAIVYLEDLQAEIKIVYRRKPQRIKAYFLAVLSIIFPIIKQIDNATGFLECTEFLSKKLNIPVKLPSL
jgi:DNA-binding MarR family transcriptional regulator